MIRKFKNYIVNLPGYKKLVYRLDRIRLRKKKVSVYQILENLILNIRHDDILHHSQSMAFSFTLAVFPAIIFLFSLLPYIPVPQFQENIMDLLGELAMLEQVRHTVSDILSRPRGDILSFSMILALFLATNGMVELSQTFNKIYKTVESRGYAKTRLIALLLTIGMGVVVFISIILLIVGEFTLDFLINNGILTQDFLLYSIVALRFSVLLLLFLFAISFIYFFAPALHNRWKFISIGSVIASLLSLFVSYLFSIYINNFGTYNKLYGSIGAMIAMMVWIYMISVILLIGFEINVSIDQAIVQMQEKEKPKGGEKEKKSVLKEKLKD